MPSHSPILSINCSILNTVMGKIFLLTLIFVSGLSAEAQKHPNTLYAGDTCFGHYTSFTPVNDSIYKVIRFSDHIHLFEGYVLRPAQLSNFYINPEEKAFQIPTGFVFDSICVYRDFDDNVIGIYQYKNRQLISQKSYIDSKLSFSLETRNGTQTSKHFDSKGKMIEFKCYNPHKQTYEIRSDEEHSIYRTAPGSSRYISVKGDYVVKKSGGKPSLKIHYYRGTMKVKDEETYMDGKKQEYKSYDPKGHISLQRTYKDGRQFREIQFTYQVDSINDKIYQTSAITFPVKQVLWSYTAQNKRVEYQINQYKFSYNMSDDSMNAQFENTANPRIHSTLLRSGNTYFQTTSFGPYQVRKHFETYDNPLDDNLLNGANHMYQYIILFPFQELSDSNNFEDYLSMVPAWYTASGPDIDSFFTSGELSRVIVRNEDTVYDYTYKNGQASLSFCSHYLHKAKDQANCGVGLKHLNGQWLNDFRYTDILDFTFQDKEMFHFAESSGYVTIYDWQGNIVMPPTKGLMIENLVDDFGSSPYYLNKALADSLSLKYNYVIQVENMDDSIFGLVDIYGHFLLKAKYGIIPIYDLDYNKLMTGWLYNDNEKYGYGDWKGHHIEPKYNSIIRLAENILLVNDDSGYTLINLNEQNYLNEHFDRYDFRSERNRLCLSRNNKRHKVIDLDDMTVALDLYDDSMADWGDLKLLYNKSTRLYTLLNNDYNYELMTGYEQIKPLRENMYICKDHDHFDFYPSDFYQKTELKADSIVFPVFQNRLLTNYFDNGFDDDYFHTSTFNATYHEFLLNNKRGLCQNSGNVLIPAAYDAIYIDQFSNYYGFNGKEFDFFIYDQVERSWTISPEKSFRSFRQVNNLYTSGNVYLLDAGGRVIEESCDAVIRIGENHYSVKKNGRILGIIDKKGTWVNRMEDISSLQYENHYILFKNQMNKAGIMNCKMETLMPAEADFITLPQFDRYVWYNLPVNNGSLYYFEQLQNIWQLKDLKTGKALSDTFFYPISLSRHYSIVRNNHDQLAILDSNLNYFRGYIYTDYFKDLYTNHLIFMTSKGKGFDVFDEKFNFRKFLDYDDIKPFDGLYIALKNNTTYILDSSLDRIDSSHCLFVNREDKLKPWSLKDSMTLYELYLGDNSIKDNFNAYYDYYFKRNEINMEDMRKMNFSPVSLNFLELIQTLNTENLSRNLDAISVYFLPSVESYNYYHWGNEHPFNPAIWTSIGDVSGPKPCNYSDFLNKDRHYSMRGIYQSFTSYYYGDGYSSSDYVTYYFSDEGALSVALNDFISPENQMAFNRLFKSKLTVIDDPEAPCWKVDDPFETYNNSFIINSRGLTFYLEGGFKITISIQELKPLFKPEWADKF